MDVSFKLCVKCDSHHTAVVTVEHFIGTVRIPSVKGNV